jgi:signal transduction histidine kinase
MDVCYRVQLPNGQTKQLRVVAQLLGDAKPRRVIGVLQDCTQSTLAERVAFIVSLEEQGLYIAVEDQGPGIDAETAAQIFRPFFFHQRKRHGLG